MTVDSANNRVYVAVHEEVSLAIIDTGKNRVIRKIKESLTPETPYNGSPWGVAVF